MKDKNIEMYISEIVSLYFDGYTIKQAIEKVKELQREVL